MFVRAVRYTKGYVLFEGTGVFVERFLNLCTQNGIAVWDYERQDLGFSCCTLATNYKKLRKIARKTGIKIRVLGKNGAPFITHRYRKRYGIYLGFLGLITALIILSSYVWKIEVVGNNRLSEQIIIENLEDFNVKVPVRKTALDTSEIEREMLLRLQDLSWIAINITGSKITVEINERDIPPPSLDISTPSNVIASRTGQIVHIEAYDGQPLLKAGDSVNQGDLIISGVVQDKTGNSYLKHANGRVIARVDEVIKAKIELIKKEELETGEVFTNRQLVIFGARVPLGFTKKTDEAYITETQERQLSLLGFELPLGLCTERLRLTETVETVITPKEAKELAIAEVETRRKEILKDAKIFGRTMSATVDENIYSLTAVYDCEINIAQEQEILIN